MCCRLDEIKHWAGSGPLGVKFPALDQATFQGLGVFLRLFVFLKGEVLGIAAGALERMKPVL